MGGERVAETEGTSLLKCAMTNLAEQSHGACRNGSCKRSDWRIWPFGRTKPLVTVRGTARPKSTWKTSGGTAPFDVERNAPLSAKQSQFLVFYQLPGRYKRGSGDALIMEEQRYSSPGGSSGRCYGSLRFRLTPSSTTSLPGKGVRARSLARLLR